MTITTIPATQYLVYTSDPWQTRSSFCVRGVMGSPTLAEGLKNALIKNDVEDEENIHILPVEPNECCMEGGFLL